MNIFFLSANPRRCARWHCDKHVVKMILESAQLLSTVQSQYNIPTKYKPTHVNHPCTKWVAASKANYRWLLTHAKALCEEYTKRYNKIHACQELIDDPLSIVPDLPDIEITPFAQAMPDKYKNVDPVQAYRDYYIGEKSGFAVWKHGNQPDWFLKI